MSQIAGFSAQTGVFFGRHVIPAIAWICIILYGNTYIYRENSEILSWSLN